MSWSELSVQELAQWREQGKEHSLIDVREDWELAEVRLSGVMHIRMEEIPHNIGRIKALGHPVVMLCHAGIRSAHCAAWLTEQGIDELYSVRGGLHAWAQEIDSSIGFY